MGVFTGGAHIKAHQHSSRGTEMVQAISKSVAGRAARINLAVDANGNPINFILSDSTNHNMKVASHLIDENKSKRN